MCTTNIVVAGFAEIHFDNLPVLDANTLHPSRQTESSDCGTVRAGEADATVAHVSTNPRLNANGPFCVSKMLILSFTSTHPPTNHNTQSAAIQPTLTSHTMSIHQHDALHVILASCVSQSLAIVAEERAEETQRVVLERPSQKLCHVSSPTFHDDRGMAEKNRLRRLDRKARQGQSGISCVCVPHCPSHLECVAGRVGAEHEKKIFLETGENQLSLLSKHVQNRNERRCDEGGRVCV
ncbi:hypothetical protein BLNAU_12044 [Blattamonas nauphoetae]|uniref:Uncharacterized protein n=1 Tax=Blattamonas nauphoetae TaxID=2049346 RepID=A0ABQ9XPD5_9EUKA|nr:hypothetical protein BLNAU_12044 [Blattamonas nauphoetae]